MINFNEHINRRNTNCIKYDFPARYSKPEGLLPLWIADMDFQIPKEVTEVLQKSVNHSIFGYTESKEPYFQSVHNWYAQRYGYHTKEEWLVKTPGVTFALGMAIKAFTSPDDSILIQTPLYPPIANTIKINNRNVVDSTLVYTQGRYEINMSDFEKKIRENNVKMFILCNPHNPVGRVWLREELQEMGHICKKYNVLVVSDEIHCDIVLPGHKHIVFSTVCEDVPSVICTAPSKTFNIAGLQVSNNFIQDSNLRDVFQNEILSTGYHQLNSMGLAAGQAAYEHGHNWLAQLIEYLTQNAAYVKKFLATNMPQVKVTDLQGTYLMWLDFSALNISHSQLEDMLTNNAQLWLVSGTAFGETGEGFFRMNIACPRSTLEEAMERLLRIM